MWEKWGDGDVTRLEMKKKTEREMGKLYSHTSTRDNVLTHWEISSLLILRFSHTFESSFSLHAVMFSVSGDFSYRDTPGGSSWIILDVSLHYQHVVLFASCRGVE